MNEDEDQPQDQAPPEDQQAVPETTIESFSDELRLVEALLFASSSPLDEDGLKLRLPEGADVAALIEEVIAIYAPRGVNIVRVAGGWTVRTAPDLAPRLKLTQKVGRKLSRAAIETLAVVAYHQPVTRGEIEEIRGVVISRGTLDTLMEAGWIVPKGRKQTVGRPATWVTTEAFLLHFGLASLADLPGMDELRAAGLVGPRPVATLRETIAAADERLPAAPGEDDEDDDELDDDDADDVVRSQSGSAEAESAESEAPESEDADDEEDAVEEAEAVDDDNTA